MQGYLYWVKAEEVPEAQAEAWLRTLPAEKRRRLTARPRDEKFWASLFAERLLLVAVQEGWGISSEHLPREVTPQGKPYFVGSRICFSLSHSGSYALAAAAECPVGADIQCRRPVEELRIAQRLFSAEEYAVLEAATDPAARERLFYRIWTCWESAGKCSGRGLWHVPGSVLDGGVLCGRYFLWENAEVTLAACGTAEVAFRLRHLKSADLGAM